MYSPNRYLLGNPLLNFCEQIACGMSYLSKKGYIHRDLAARNVLLDTTYNCKVQNRFHKSNCKLFEVFTEIMYQLSMQYNCVL